MARITRVFLDCEWADVFGRDLVSIGLVSQNGCQQFYAEREQLPEPTPWVEQVVFPRLQRGEVALSDVSMSQALSRYLASIDTPCVCYDAARDKALCVDMLMRSQPGTAVADRLTWELLTDTERALNQWWESHPEERPMRHHALVDAKALRAAWLSLWGV